MDEVAKSRVKILVILLAAVALIHLAVLGVFVIGKKGSAPEETPAEAAKEETAAAKKPEPPVSRYRKPSSNPNFGKPFVYTYAVNGDMPKLPDGKGARSGFLVDLNTRNVLWVKNHRKPVPVASMVKMMTLLTAFEELERRPDWTFDTPVQITRGATRVARTGIIWLDTRETMPLGDLLKALTIKSANDAAYQVAEFAGNGDVTAFVARMNGKAVQLGMPGTKFVSPHGLPDKVLGNSLSTAEGMTILGERLLEYPDIMEWTSTQKTYIRNGKTELTNTNGLINPRWPGVDGLKTGYTRDAGYCLTFTCERNGRRLMGCVTGFSSAGRRALRKGRDPFVRKLIDWGFERAAAIEQSGAAKL